MIGRMSRLKLTRPNSAGAALTANKQPVTRHKNVCIALTVFRPPAWRLSTMYLRGHCRAPDYMLIAMDIVQQHRRFVDQRKTYHTTVSTENSGRGRTNYSTYR